PRADGAPLTRSKPSHPLSTGSMSVAVRSMSSTPIDPRVRAAAAGDRRAAEALLRELLPRVRNLVRYLVRGDAEVDDLAQQAMIAILRGLPTYRGEGTFTSWADRVTARSVLSNARRVRAERARIDATPDLAAVPSPDAGPDDYLLRRETVRLLDLLPPEQ